MNVAELKEALDDYGDHLPVVIEIDKGERSQFVSDLTVNHRSQNNEPQVVITVEV